MSPSQPTGNLVIHGRISFREKISKNPVPYFITAWFVLNLIQSYHMELTSDEGYYWFYAQHLQWGYYDHPPIVALMIRAGVYLLPGELGVRLFNIIFSAAGLYLFFTLLPGDVKKKKHTYLILLATPLLHYLAFIVFPDGPLLFFSLLFLVLYKRLLTKKSLSSAILLGISLGLMAYSKYHGALVFLFTLAANPKFLKSVYLYTALLVALILFIPHIWWQYQHNFQTLEYNFSGRTSNLSFRYVGEYISQQILVFGPGLIFLPFVIKTKDVFERTLKFIIIGTFLFFLFSSFKTFIHFHWTSIAVFPILYFAINYYNNPKRKKLYYYLIMPFVIILFIARLLLIFPILESMHVSKDYYHGRTKWADDIKNIAQDKFVFMPNNLREAPLYSFYSGKRGVSLFTFPEKKSQYDIWNYEDSLQGKNIVMVTPYAFPGSTGLMTRINQQIYYSEISSFRSYYSGIEIKTILPDYQSNDTALIITLQIINHRNTVLLFNHDDNDILSIFYEINKKNTAIKYDLLQPLTISDNLLPGHSIKKVFTIPIKGFFKNGHKIYFGIRNGALPDALLSKPIDI